MASSSIPWTQIKALSFDIYGTLVDWEGGILHAARSTALAPYLPSDDKTLLLAIEEHDTSIQRDQPTLPQTQIIREGLRRYATSDLHLLADGHLTPAELDAACEAYSSHIGAYPAFADTVAAIQSLGKHFALVPLTNVDNASFATTRAGPLAGCHFDAIYTAQDIGSYKPALRNFHYLLDHLRADLGVEKDQLCHVAQSLFHDHGPAKEMGLWSVWVDRGGKMGGQTEGAQERFGFQLRVESLGELAEIVERAFAA